MITGCKYCVKPEKRPSKGLAIILCFVGAAIFCCGIIFWDKEAYYTACSSWLFGGWLFALGIYLLIKVIRGKYYYVFQDAHSGDWHYHAEMPPKHDEHYYWGVAAGTVTSNYIPTAILRLTNGGWRKSCWVFTSEEERNPLSLGWWPEKFDARNNHVTLSTGGNEKIVCNIYTAMQLIMLGKAGNTIALMLRDVELKQRKLAEKEGLLGDLREKVAELTRLLDENELINNLEALAAWLRDSKVRVEKSKVGKEIRARLELLLSTYREARTPVGSGEPELARASDGRPAESSKDAVPVT
jgi:hypothetical protein